MAGSFAGSGAMSAYGSITTVEHGSMRRVPLIGCIVGLMAWSAPVMSMSPDGPPAGPAASVPQSLGEELSGPLRVVVDGDGDEQIEDADLLFEWILARHSAIADQLPAAEREQWVFVHIGGKTYEFAVSVLAVRDGVPARTVAARVPCDCTNEMLLDQLEGFVAAAVAELRPQRTKQPPPPPPPPPTARPLAPPRSLRLGPLGYSGIGLTVVGAGLLGAGIPLARQPDELRDQLSGHPTRYTTRPAGIAMTTGGGVALAGGVAMLVADMVRPRRSSFAARLMTGRKLVGVSITRRF